MKISESEIIYENDILGVHLDSGLTRLVNEDQANNTDPIIYMSHL